MDWPNGILDRNNAAPEPYMTTTPETRGSDFANTASLPQVSPNIFTLIICSYSHVELMS